MIRSKHIRTAEEIGESWAALGDVDHDTAVRTSIKLAEEKFSSGDNKKEYSRIIIESFERAKGQSKPE